MLQMLASEYRVIAQDIFAFVLILSAFFWGGGPERAVALTWLVVFEIGGRVKDVIFGSELRLTDVDLFWASADVVAGVSWLTIALFANRNYTLWIAALQLLATSAHLVRGMVEAVSPIAYVVMVVAPGWFQLFLLAGGLICHARRKNSFGEYRDWRKPQNAAQARLFERLTSWNDRASRQIRPWLWKGRQ